MMGAFRAPFCDDGRATALARVRVLRRGASPCLPCGAGARHREHGMHHRLQFLALVGGQIHGDPHPGLALRTQYVVFFQGERAQRDFDGAKTVGVRARDLFRVLPEVDVIVEFGHGGQCGISCHTQGGRGEGRGGYNREGYNRGVVQQ